MKLHEHIQVTAEVMGQRLSDAAVAAIADKLKGYPLDDVRQALDRCAAERRSLRLADVLERLPGCHPGSEEAWALVAPALADDGATVVWTDEMAKAFGAAATLKRDPVAARMAFKQAYERQVGESRGKMPKWWPSLGTDPHRRQSALNQAAALGRLPKDHLESIGLLPARTGDGMAELGEGND
jgi:hypothetical protein